MTSKKKINIIGAGGHSRPIIEVLNAHFKNRKKFIYDLNFKKKKSKEKILGCNVVGSLNDFLKEKNTEVYLAIGDNNLRMQIFKKLKKLKIKLPNLISNDASMSKFFNIGVGNFINKQAFIGPDVIIGNNNIINTRSVLEHQTTLGSNSHIGPKSIIGGHVKIGNNVLIGLGSKVINNVKICNNCIIGAGSVVTKNINKPGTYVGIPAKKIKTKSALKKKKF